MGATTLWLGTYPPSGPEGTPGQGEGIWRLSLDTRTGSLSGVLAAAVPAPSFLARGPGRMLYAVSETAPGTVTALELTDDALVPVATVAAGGDSPCHLLVTDRALYVSCYASGSLSVLPLDPDGRFDAQVMADGGPVQVHGHQGSGPRADRQEAPHAHSAILSPDGGHVLVADLGTDELRRLRLRPDGLLDDEGLAATLPPGTGPRHMAQGPGGHLYVVGELDVTVHVLRWDGPTATAVPVQVLPACERACVSGHQVLPSHITLHDGDVWVGVRGSDVVARFTVHDDGARLRHEQDRPVGPWPRHMALVDGFLVTAAQNAGRVTTHPVLGGRVAGEVTVPFPACVVPH